MASVTSKNDSPSRPHELGTIRDAARDVSLELRRLQRNLLRAITTCNDRAGMLSAACGLVDESTNPTAVRYYARGDSNELTSVWQRAGEAGKRLTAPRQEALSALCREACRQGQVQIDTLEDGGAFVLAVPVFLRNQPPEGFLFVFPRTTRRLERTVVKLQLVAAHVTLWHVLQEAGGLDDQVRKTAALVELLERTAACGDLQHACYTLVCQLQESLGWDCVALGLKRSGRDHCILQAISGRAKFDRNSDRTRSFEAALDEALLRGTAAQWPADDGSAPKQIRTLERACRVSGAAAAFSGPIQDARGNAVGAWLFLADRRDHQRHADARFIDAAQQPVGACLALLQSAEVGRVRKLVRQVVESRKTWQAKAAVAAGCLLATILALPLPYNVKADCQLQPLTRRYVVAPFDGRLEQALVQPSDVIAQGDVLARMDGRDIRWELAGLVAEHGRAAKRRDVALAGHDVVTAQLARLEMEKLELEMKMLDDRADNLDVKSPIDGIVISGDQQRAEGAPLTAGQSLFEIAPLDQLVVEIGVPEEEIPFVRVGMRVTIRLDAFPRKEWTGALKTLHPRSEQRDDRNIFVAEVCLDNPDDVLRPGMNGRAEVRTDRHSLAWNLLHKPCESALAWLGW